MSKNWLSEDLWRAHVSWLTPEWIGNTKEGRKAFKAVEWLDNLQRAKYTTLIFYTKFHDGNCTFKSKYDATPAPERDYFGECIAEAKKRDMKVMTYYSSVIDYELALKHEDWRVVGRDGRLKGASFSFYGNPGSYLCINNSEYRQLMLNQIHEILAYNPDGFWLDVYSLKTNKENCFCPCCREKYHTETGGDIFDTIDDSWYYKCYVDFLKVINNEIKAHNPDCVLTVNQGPRMPECNETVDFYTTESGFMGGGARGASKLSRALRDGKKPFEMTYRMYTLPGSWSMRSTETIKLESAMIVAHGGACSIEIAPTNTGYFQKDAIDTLEKVGTYIRSIEKYCVDTKPIYDAAYMLPPHLRGVLWRWDSVMTEHDVPFRFLYMDNMDADLSRYQLIILDPSMPLNKALVYRLESYVSNGGNLIVECNTGESGSTEYNKLLELLGLKSTERVAGDIRYLSNFNSAIKDNIGEDPIIVENVRDPYHQNIDAPIVFDSPYYEVVPETARSMAFYNYACGDRGLGKNVWYRLPPLADCSDKPAITVNNYGKGKAMFIACPLVFSELNFHKNGTDRRVFSLQLAANLVKYMDNEPLLRSTTPAGVEIVVNRQEKRHIVHVLNRYLEGEYLEGRNDLLKLAELLISINSERIGDVKKVCAVGDGKEPKEIDFKRDGKWIEIELPVLATNEILIVE